MLIEGGMLYFIIFVLSILLVIFGYLTKNYRAKILKFENIQKEQLLAVIREKEQMLDESMSINKELLDMLYQVIDLKK
jgi:hypothetical protein